MKRFRLSALALVVLALLLTAVSAQANGRAAGPGAAALARYKAVPTFVPPGPTFDARKLRGKTIFNIPVTSAVPFVTQIDNSMAKVARLVGVKFIEFPNQGQPAQWVAGFNQAITRKVDLIILSAAIDPTQLRPQIQAATKAGIPVLDTHFYDLTAKVPPGVHYVRADFKTAAELDAYWIIEETAGKGNVLIVTSPELQLTKLINATHRAVFGKNCAACKLSFLGVAIPDLATKMQSAVQSELLKNPKLNSIILEYDAMAQFVVPALAATGKTDSVKIATFNGTDFALRFIQDGKLGMDVGENLDWLGWADMDQAMRILAGLSTVANEHTPLRVFDATNVAQAGTPPRVNAGYGNGYIAGYKKLWGLTR